VHPDLEQIVVEDEAARAAVERASGESAARLDAEVLRLARAREEGVRALAAQLEKTISDIEQASGGAVEERRARRARYIREQAARAEPAIDAAADAYARIVREGPFEGTS
jgi:hypothetical protein